MCFCKNKNYIVEKQKTIMLRKSVIKTAPTQLTPTEKRKCKCIVNFILTQCMVVFFLQLTVMSCLWKPNLISFDPYKLASIMYLYDQKECEYESTVALKAITNMRLSNDTKGFNVLPIRWTPALVTVSTRLSHKTRTYIKLSVLIHFIWMLLSILFKLIINKSTNTQLLVIALHVYFYALLFVIIFDLSMGIVYAAHIKQALTKGMIVRYSGWSLELKLKNYNDFAGYLPLIAASCWMRGIVVLAINIYSCKIINKIAKKRAKKNILTRLSYLQHNQLPEATNEEKNDSHILYFRPGETKPFSKNDLGSSNY